MDKNGVIRSLPETLINQIAAGEVVERPSSVVKELIENSLDAKATDIRVFFENGGKTRLVILDNGTGMGKGDLPKAVARHATSKLPQQDLHHIEFLGFRGEALAAIASVSRMTLSSRTTFDPQGWALDVIGGKVGDLMPTAFEGTGTRVEVRDLFFSTPARLKFMRADNTERAHILETVRTLAMAHPHVSFTLQDKQKVLLKVPSTTRLEDRLATLLPDELQSCLVALGTPPKEAFSAPSSVYGYLSGAGTVSYPRPTHLYLFMNGRFVRDKVLLAAVRDAFADVLPKGHYPGGALFLSVDPQEVDVNVHPSKTEVRFHRPGEIRQMIFSVVARQVRAGLSKGPVGSISPDSFSSPSSPSPSSSPSSRSQNPSQSFSSSRFEKGSSSGSFRPSMHQKKEAFNLFSPKESLSFRCLESTSEDSHKAMAEQKESSLGVVLAQVFHLYILSRTEDSLFLIDQHAAHERIVYEQLKESLETNTSFASQGLLFPLPLSFSVREIAFFEEHQEMWEKLGLVYQITSSTELSLKALPAPLDAQDATKMMKDLGETLEGVDPSLSLKQTIDRLLAKMACYGSVRAGRSLSAEEMQSLLTQLENTPSAWVCNHGRPTVLKLSLSNLETLFHRH